VIRRNKMVKDLICPVTQICPIYKLENETRYDCIEDKEGNYSCRALSKFNHFIDRDKVEIVSKLPAECALIEILNRTNTL
jgi:hypothetical protein